MTDVEEKLAAVKLAQAQLALASQTLAEFTRANFTRVWSAQGFKPVLCGDVKDADAVKARLAALEVAQRNAYLKLQAALRSWAAARGPQNGPTDDTHLQVNQQTREALAKR